MFNDIRINPLNKEIKIQKKMAIRSPKSKLSNDKGRK